MTTIALPREEHTFWKRWTPLFSAGMLGIGALTAATARSALEQLSQVPGLADLPAPAQLAVAIVQPSVLLAASVAVGVAVTPRLGLRSWIAEKFARGESLWARLRPELPLALGAGAITGAATIIADLASRPLMPPMKAGGEQLAEALSHTTVPSVLATLLYGGISEELLMRWGVMALVAWVGWRLAQRGQGEPKPAIMWSAIMIAALLFGVGHLPATAQLYELTPFVIARGLILNGAFGIFAGWLFWRRSLESAMAAHMAAHVVLTIFNVAAAAFTRAS